MSDPVVTLRRPSISNPDRWNVYFDEQYVGCVLRAGPREWDGHLAPLAGRSSRPLGESRTRREMVERVIAKANEALEGRT